MEKDTNPKDAIGTAKWRQFFCVPMQVLWEVGVGMLEGTLKYGRHNYRGSGVRASVYVDAAIGHIQSFVEGEDIDEDSGLSHITKAICSLFVLRDAQMNDFWTDDRPPKIKDLPALRERLQALVAENFERYADKDPHHYSHEEDGAPYQGGSAVRPTMEDEVMERFRNSTQYAEMLIEEKSRRDMQGASLAQMADAWFAEFEQEKALLAALDQQAVRQDDAAQQENGGDVEQSTIKFHSARPEIDKDPLPDPNRFIPPSFA